MILDGIALYRLNGAAAVRLCHNGAMRLALVSLCCLRAWAADTMPPEAEQRLAREIYKQMIEVKSGFTTGSTTPIAESVAARFKAAGFPASDIFVGGAIPTKTNVVVRYRGTGARKPILLLAHIDVVEALRADWTVDPFVFLERDGYYLRTRYRGRQSACRRLGRHSVAIQARGL